MKRLLLLCLLFATPAFGDVVQSLNYNTVTKTVDAVTQSNGTKKLSTIVGTTTNDNACAGCIGEYYRSAGTYNCVAGNYGTDMGNTASSLTAGDWDCTLQYSNAGTVASNTQVLTIAPNSGTTTTGQVEGDNQLTVVLAGNASGSETIANYRISQNTSATWYFKGKCSTSDTFHWRASCRRPR